MTESGNLPKIAGVHFKRFEKVLSNILPIVEPEYVCLPPACRSESEDWPFHDYLPHSARIWGDHPGQLKDRRRAARKEGQIRSLLRCIMRLVPANTECTIVDFGGGSGHLALPLALLLPNAVVCVVDLRKHSLDLMHNKANLVVEEVLQSQEYRRFMRPNVHKSGNTMKCCGKDGVLTNLFAWHGPVESFHERLDLGLALHLCGEATDVALRRAGDSGAMGIVVAPCCVGKLSTRAMNPDVYHATGFHQATRTISYPQSSLFCRLISDQDDWDKLAKAADYSNELEFNTVQNAPRRTAKALVETDRRLFLQERYQYKTALLKMDPLESTPKNDIIVAWKPALAKIDDSLFGERDSESSRDVEMTRTQLAEGTCSAGSVNWSEQEEAEIAVVIVGFLQQTKGTAKEFKSFIFPTQMGGRKRKLIHYVASKMDLAHWSVGDKSIDKTVAIARRRRKRSRSE
ncbi:unnamed protein product [Cylindrotheca closterium]|uniref:R3H domain-containing protein n=1 Tax=Cylindrotheca closterium TaxID=2856 RepID=A0AAD2FK41_9STRA|nr:unnamed protein product [Cylindrotheca closterium]